MADDVYPDELSRRVQTMLRYHVGDLDPNAEQQAVIDDVLEVDRCDYLRLGRGAGKTTARLMACLALLESEEY